MKLILQDDFTLEYNDKTFYGTLENVTRKQSKQLEFKHKSDTGENDALFKERLQMSMQSDQKVEIMAIGEEYNYKIIFETIIKDIAEKNEKK